MGEMTQTLAMETVRREVHDHIQFNFLYDGEGAALDDDASLLERGVLDATGVLELVLFVEETYGLEVAEADLIPENFDTVNNVARYVVRQLSAK
jgi:acyl carrier protein